MYSLRFVVVCLLILSCPSFAVDWEVANSGLVGYTVADIAIDQSNPNILYCSTKAGVYKSTDGGASWVKSSSGLATVPYAGQLCMDPTNSARIYVQAADASGYRYVWRTDNAAGYWYQKSSGINHPWIRGITVSKSNPNIVYCGTIIGGDNGGCYRSDNYGDNWTQTAGSDIPGSGLENDCTPVVVDPTDPNRVYCGRSYYVGFLKSTDGGYHWTWTDVSYVVRGIAVNPDNPARVIACGEGKLRLSTNYGDTFVDKITGISFQAVVHAPSDSNIVYATATSGGIWKSTNAGDSWSQVSGSELYSYSRIAVHPINPNIIYCVTSGRGIARSTDGGHTFTFLNSGLPTEIAVGYMDVQPGTGAVYVFVNYVGLYRTFDEGASWQFVSAMPDFPKGFEICRSNPSVMYYVAWPVDKVMKSTDGGFTWAPTPTQPDAVNYYECVAVDPTNPNRVFVAGENTDKVYRTTDGGQTWQAVHTLTPSPDWGNKTCWSITIDPTNPQRVYLATYNHPWRSDDGGNTWVMQDTLHYGVYYGQPPVLKDTSFVRKIDIDPVSPNILYASTQWGGTWKSTDYGDHWVRIWDMGGSITNNTLIDSRDHNTIYISTVGSGVKKSTNSGATWTDMSSGGELYPSVLRQSLTNPSRLYQGAGTQGVYRTPGGSWGLTIDQAKALPDGAYCLLAEDPIVSLKYPDGWGCLENANRLRGIRATNLGSFNVGDKLRVRGTIKEDEADKYMQVDKATLVSTANEIKPLSMSTKAINEPTAPSGILSRVWGTVSHSGSGWCYLDDGSGAVDGTGKEGIKIRLDGVPQLEPATFAVVEGVLGKSFQDGRTVPCLTVHSLNSILIGKIGNYLLNPEFESGNFYPWNATASAQLINGTWYFSISAHSGTGFVGIYGNYATYSGILYQQTEVKPGRNYRAMVWSRVLHGGNNQDSAMNRIGIDPTGGTDPTSPKVIWSDWDSQPAWYYSEWKQISTPAVVCWDTKCTVFLEYKQQNTSGWHINCFDDAKLEALTLP